MSEKICAGNTWRCFAYASLSSVLLFDRGIRGSGVSCLHEGLKGKVEFQGRLTARNTGGRITCADGVLSVEGADEAIVYVSIATNFNNYQDITGNPAERAKDYLVRAMTHSFTEARKNHTDFYRRYLTRVSLDLGDNRYEHVTTDKRVENFKQTNDAHLVATYFQFGRYLLICSSQPGGQPANLQGIWNDKLFPSWDSKYTCNINLEMNYWPSEVTNLSELNEPLFRLIREVSETGKETARIMYGANGWVLHHNTDIWRITGAVDKAPSGLWPSGGAWLCRHLWERYLYTGDTEFLRSVYPDLESDRRMEFSVSQRRVDGNVPNRCRQSHAPPLGHKPEQSFVYCARDAPYVGVVM